MARYSGISTIKDEAGQRLYKTVKYPEIPRNENDIYVITTDGDRYDNLALEYYKDSSLWWVIASANNEYSKNSLFTPRGVQLRIPSNISSILTAYNALNQ